MRGVLYYCLRNEVLPNNCFRQLQSFVRRVKEPNFFKLFSPQLRGFFVPTTRLLNYEL